MSEFLTIKRIPVIFLAVLLLTSLFAGSVFAGSDEAKPAIFFQSVDDELKAWLMDQEVREDSEVFATVEAGWQAKALADMDGNGHPDIYWLHEDGNLKVWLMEGLEHVGTEFPLNPGTGESKISPVWDMMAVADLNDSGSPDIIWQALSGPREGDLAIWLMDGVNADRFGKLFNHPGDASVSPLWEIGAVFDLLDDGQPEVLWQSVSGEAFDQLAYWQLDVDGDEFTRKDSGRLTHIGDRAEIRSEWRMKAAVDLMGDGNHEIIFQGIAGNVEDRVSYWVMDGPARVGGGRLDPDTVSPGWTVFGAAPIQVEPPLLEIVSVEAITDSVAVPYGTDEAGAIAELEEKTEYEGVVAEEDNVTLTVTGWQAVNGYDSTTPGAYVFEGEAQAPEGYKFAEGVETTVSATVTVLEDAAYFAPSITLTPDDVVARGGELTVEARVENTGGVAATQNVTGTLIGPDDLEIDGFTEEVTLDAGADLEHVWEFDVPEDADLGVYTFVLETEDDTATATVEVVEAAFFLPSITLIPDDEVVRGGKLTVEARVENTGGITATQDVTGTLIGPDDQEIDGFTEEVTLDAGADLEHVWEFDVPEDADLGTYTFVLETEDDTATATVEVVEDPMMLLEDLKNNTSLDLEAVGNVVTATIEYPAEISDVLADYMTDALITADDGFAKGTLVEIKGIGIDGVAELAEETDAIYLSELIEMIDDTLPTRTPITGHAGRTDVLEITITSPVTVDTNLQVAAVVSDDNFATEFEIASDDVDLDFAADKDLALEALKRDTTMMADFDGEVIEVKMFYPAVIDVVLDDYLTDATIEVVAGYDEFPAGTEIEITYNGTVLGTAVLDEDTDGPIFLSELIAMADEDASVRTSITAHAGREDVWEFAIIPADDVRSKLDLASVIDDNDFSDPVVIAEADVYYEFFPEPEMLALKDLRDNTTLELTLENANEIKAETQYASEDEIRYHAELDDYMVDVLLTAENELVKGTIIEFNGMKVQLEEDEDELYLSDLILMADDEATVRPKVKELFGETDVWNFKISSPVKIEENNVTAKVMVAKDFDYPIMIAQDKVELNIAGDIEELKADLEVTVVKNYIYVDVTYDGIAETLKYYNADALIERDYGDRFVAGTEIQIFYNGNDVGVAELTEQTEKIYLSELIAKADPDAPVRTPITAHEGTDQWVLIVTPPGEGRFVAGGTIKSQVSDDGFVTAETLDTDTFDLDFKYPYDTDNPVYLYDAGGFLAGTFNTIGKAIEDADDDYTVLVYPGTYEENVTVNVDGLTLKSVEKHEAIVEGYVAIQSDGVTLENFHIDLDTAVNRAPVDLMDINGVTIRGNKVEGGPNTGGISAWTGPAKVYGNVLIEDNEITKGPIGLILGDQEADVTIRNNTMTEPGDEGIWVWQNKQAALTIEGNTVTEAGADYDVKIVDKPLSINGETAAPEMYDAILSDNPGISTVLFEWIVNLTFEDGTVELSDTQEAGKWYTDRYAPAGFESAMFEDDWRLKHFIDAVDGANNRPGGFGSAFYNTQGRKYDTEGATKMSIDLYIPADWENTGRRMAGLWATGFNADDNISLYPIIEFTSEGDDPRFRVWPAPTAGNWDDLGLPAGFEYDQWYTLTMELTADDLTFSVGDLTYTIENNDTVQLGNVILQGHNTDDGVTYEIYWDNFWALLNY